MIATEGLGPASDPPADPAEELARVAREVAARFGLTVRELRSATRRASVTGPRHLAMYLSRLYTSASVRAIGRYYGGRDAATVRHALRISAVRVESDPSLASVLASVGRGRGGRGSGG
ncbi:MAG: helix-turn-helix domain-containing protein [Isosphaeraceae bacterium]